MRMPDVIVDTFSVVLRSHLLGTGRFVAAVPASTQRAGVLNPLVKVLPVELPNKPWPVAMITLKNRTLSPAVQHFLVCARAAAKALTLGPPRKRRT
jgi:DNA-binding transcriptional LysR family regulator